MNKSVAAQGRTFRDKYLEVLLAALLIISFLPAQSQTIFDSKFYQQINNYYQWRGGRFDSAFSLPIYSDTTAANTARGVDTCGALIFTTNNKLWVRGCNPKVWIDVLGSGGSSTFQQAIDNGNTTDKNNRIVNGANDFTFTSTGSATLKWAKTDSTGITDSTIVNVWYLRQRLSAFLTSNFYISDGGFTSNRSVAGNDKILNWNNVREFRINDPSGNNWFTVLANGKQIAFGDNDLSNKGTRYLLNDSLGIHQLIGDTIDLTFTKFKASLPSGVGTHTVKYNNTTRQFTYDTSPSSAAWGSITGTLSSQTDLQTALDGKVDKNSTITGATKMKITYDAKGLVTAGADAALDDLSDVTISSPATSQVIKYNGSAWVNGTAPPATLISRGTYAQRPVSPDTGQVYWQTDRLSGQWVYDGNSWEFQGTPLNYLWHEQFNSATIGSIPRLGSFTSGTGSGAVTEESVGVGSYLKLSTGTTSGGVCAMQFATASTFVLNLDSMTQYFEYKILIPILSDVTEDFQVGIGFLGHQSSWTYGSCLFYYDYNNNGGKWETRTRKYDNSANMTYKDCGVTVAANTWYKMAIEINGYTNTIYFYIDDVLVATHTSSDYIPLPGNTAVGSQYHFAVTKIAGTTARTLYVDNSMAYIIKKKY